MAEATANQAATPKQSKLKQGLAALVWRVNRQLQWFQEIKPSRSLHLSTVLPVWFSRVACTASWQSYNIRSQRALHKVLKQKYAKSETVQFYIGPWQNNQRKVLLIELTPTAQAFREQAYTLLPESLVLSAALPNGLYEVSDGDHHYFLYQLEQQWQTLLRSGLVNNLEKARLALGCSAEKPASQITGEQLASLTPRGVSKLGLNYFQQGLQQRQSHGDGGVPWQKLGVTLASIGAIYLLISSAYLVIQSGMIANQLEAVTPKVAVLLDQQQQLQQAQQQLNELSGQFVNDQRVNGFWQVFIAAQGEGNRITYLQANDNILAIGGEISEALPLLRKLHDLPEVASAEFASSLRNTRNGQQYRIDMVLNEEGVGNDD